MSRQEWLEERRKGIGGSDAPVIYLGEYYGKTIQNLFYEKTGVAPLDREEETADMRRGHRQEPVAAALFEEQTGLELFPAPEILQHPEFPFMRASLDRWAHDPADRHGADFPLEIKCPRFSAFLKWKREGIPEGALIQGQHYLAVTGAPRLFYGVFCAEVDELLTVSVDRDDELIEKLIWAEAGFWGHVIREELPPMPNADDRPDLPPTPSEGAKVVRIRSVEWKEAVEALREATLLKDQVKMMEEEAKANLIDQMGKHEVAEGGGARIHYTDTKGRLKTDFTAMERDGIEVSKYQKRGKSFRTFRSYFFKEGGA
jgi:putative phage-type endonuclease